MGKIVGKKGGFFGEIFWGNELNSRIYVVGVGGKMGIIFLDFLE